MLRLFVVSECTGFRCVACNETGGGAADLDFLIGCRRLAALRYRQCIDEFDNSFRSRILMSDFSCMRSKIVAPTASFRWRILLMIGG